MAKEIAEEYASSLSDLTVNSKPLINMLTILAEENIEHAGVIVETVEKHLEKVPADIKLPVLYLVDSIIKNVGGAYTQKFSQSIVNMFTKTFKQVDEKIRSQMFKLRETWHDVFPSTKLYQLDVKVNLIDPAWPIQVQPQQSNIHPAPVASLAPAPTTSAALTEEEERMRSILAKKEQELLMLQRKKVEMELEQTKRQLQLAEKSTKKPPVTPVVVAPVAPVTAAPSMPVAMVSPVVPSVEPPQPPPVLSAKQRLGPPVNKSTSSNRIAPVSGVLASARRDPRLSRRPPPARSTQPPLPSPALNIVPPIAPNVFDIKPLDRVTKRKNVITIDVRPETNRDPRLDRPRNRKREERRHDKEKQKLKKEKIDDEKVVGDYMDRLQIPDPKRINKLPPIPKIQREKEDPPIKKKKDLPRDRKKRREGKDSSSSSPEKRQKKDKEKKIKAKERMEVEENIAEPEVVAFKELKNYHKEHYMRRNKEKSESPERTEKEEAKPAEESTNPPEIVAETKDVDLRVLPVITETAAPVAQKRPSTETLEGKVKKNKIDKFDILFGNEDVDLRKLPQVEEVNAPPPPSITENNIKVKAKEEDIDDTTVSPVRSPRKDWNEVKEKEESTKKTPSKLDLVRAKLAEATKVKDGLGRPLLFSKSPSIERERRRTLSVEETEVRTENAEPFDAEDHKKTISIIMNQAKEQFTDGQLDKNQYNTLMYQVLQLNEKLKLKEAKQRESLEISKRKLKAHIHEDNKVPSPKSSPSEMNNFGDIDERITPAAFVEPVTENSQNHFQDSDMRMHPFVENMEIGAQAPFPGPPMMPPMFMGPGPFPPMWRGQRPRMEEFGPRRFRGPMPPYFRVKFDKRIPRPAFDPRMPLLPAPTIGMCQGESPLKRYERSHTPPPLGTPGYNVPPTDFKILEYIDMDPVKTIQIDSIPREIRFYGETAIIMLDWDDPREIKFWPGCRRVTFDNKDSVVISFNEGYKQVEIDDQVFNIRFGAPTRELYINGRWYECFFGGQPLGVLIDGQPHLVHLEGPLPQVDIGKVKRTDLVAGKINLIVNATNICPVYLDAKVQKFHVNGNFFTIRFVDSLRTVLINEQPFKVEYGDLPKPIFVGGEKLFIRFSALPKNIKPGQVEIAEMEGSIGSPQPSIPDKPIEVPEPETNDVSAPMETDDMPSLEMPPKPPSPEGEMKGLDMLASLMPTSMAPASSSVYSSAEPLFAKPDNIPGLETPSEEKPALSLPILGNINVSDLYAKLVATGIVPQVNDTKPEIKNNGIEESPKEDKNVVHKVDLLKSQTLKVKQPAIVAKLYGGMQCSGCGARFPPEHTVRYSQHLDWHFRQNRRERDSARRAHSRHWHYDLSDWLQYEELEDLEEREKNWFETGGAEEPPAAEAEESPSAAAGAPQHHCALCGDRFQQFYNEDREEWHLRNSVRHDAHYYHPLCYQDYKASLAKEEPPKEEEESILEVDEEKSTEPIEIKDVDEGDVSDDESVVEVVEPEPVPPLEVDEEGDEDDVILKAEPVEELLVEDADTDDETMAERATRDRNHQEEFAKVKVKQEPIDPDDEPIITAEVESIPPTIDTTHTTVTSSIDGNVQLDDATPASAFPLGGIRINISKSIPSFITPVDDKLEDISIDEEPLPPGEEPELVYKLKPTLEGVQFSRQPPVQKGSELSGLCSIM
ncbi:pre-mRNA cleavage complex 2 protein Pcf11 isoform X2 [Bicyclus anynana]|uniref:Pre-mRNA cleavage complex 2 protein Pcf11 isoform X2 n=1 Tax=Bicyclus anynana TaxID=110368 RepID=A0A6J1N4G2_BICAN|nr:pre-mRNA cleavage complex 2 protein Pcf11 isoform X2 [Bicyclus anynana]